MNPRLTALQFMGDCLSLAKRDLSAQVLQQIRDDALPWEAIVELANNHLLVPALWVSLDNSGLSRELPTDLEHYLTELHGLSTERNIRLREQLLEAVGRLNQAGITPVLLKGAAHLVSSIYADPGMRIMSDIDILIDRDQAAAAYACLLDLGYKTDESHLDDYDGDHHHYPPLFRPGDYAAVEIHRGLMDGYTHILSVEEALVDARFLSCEGLALKILSPTHRILHNIVHSQLVDAHYVTGVIPLRSLNEVVVENQYFAERVDWSFIHRRIQDNGYTAMLNAYLYMAHKLLGMPWPSGRRATLRARMYVRRCKQQLAWHWFTMWGVRWGRFSAINVRKLYDCGDGVVGLNWARVRYAKMMLVRYVTKITSPASRQS